MSNHIKTNNANTKTGTCNSSVNTADVNHTSTILNFLKLKSETPKHECANNASVSASDSASDIALTLNAHIILLVVHVGVCLFTPLVVGYWPLIQLIQASTDPSQRFDLIALNVALFGTVYILITFMLNMLSTDQQVSKIIASRFISTLHASIVVVSCILCVQSQHHSSWFNIQTLRVNTPSEQRIFEISAGFFIVDIAVLLFKTRCRINNKESILLMCHHIITLYFMLTSGWYGHDGAIGIVGLIFAESTSPFVSMWTIARALKSKYHLAWTSPLFTITFSFMRFITMTWSLIDGVPRWLFRRSYYLTTTTTATTIIGLVTPVVVVVDDESDVVDDPCIPPLIIRISWCLLYSLLCIGGWIWSKDAIIGLHGYYKKQRQSRQHQQIKPMMMNGTGELKEHPSPIFNQMKSPFSPMTSRDAYAKLKLDSSATSLELSK